MSLGDLILDVRRGDKMMVCDFRRTPSLVQIKLLCLPVKSLLEIDPPARTVLLVACRTYLLLAKDHVENEGELVTDFSGSDGIETDEIMQHVNDFVAWASREWPTEYQYVRGVVRDLDTARLCLVPDPHPEGFVSVPTLFPNNFGGQAINLIVDPAPLGRTPLLIATPGGYYLQTKGLPHPEGVKICSPEYKLHEQ